LSGWLRTFRTGCSGKSAPAEFLSAAFSRRDGVRHAEIGSDAPTEQRLHGFEPFVAWAGGLDRGDFPEPAQGADACFEPHRVGIPVAIINQGPTRGDAEATLTLDAPLGSALTALAGRLPDR
jgi:hypothetical protein